MSTRGTSRHREVTRKMQRSRNSLSRLRGNAGPLEWLRAQ